MRMLCSVVLELLRELLHAQTVEVVGCWVALRVTVEDVHLLEFAAVRDAIGNVEAGTVGVGA